MLMIYSNIKNGINVVKKYVNNLSANPGIYKMIDKDQEVMYIGKAKDLRQRIAQYSNINTLPYRLQKMISLLHSIDVLYTRSENEALIIELNLIQSIQPKYNIALKDDKSFTYILLDIDHKFPKIIKSRGKEINYLISFGPFFSTNKANTIIREIQKVFLVRNCSNYDFITRTKPCLLYQTHLCSAPCVNKISEQEYDKLVRQLKNFLAGKTDQVYTYLVNKMKFFSNKLMYEKAAKVRDKIQLLNSIQRTPIIYGISNKNIDIFFYHKINFLQKYCIQIHFIRNSRHFGDKYHYFDNDNIELTKEVMCKFIIKFYQKNVLPDEIWYNVESVSSISIKKTIEYTAQRKIKIRYLESNNSKTLQLIANDVKSAFAKDSQHYFNKINVFKDLVNKFNLPYIPERIEVYDNSHHHGYNVIGCVIVVDQNGFVKSEYRKYNMSNGRCMDDYFILKEVIKRRFTRINCHVLPDLMIIDGGKGQLSTVINELYKLNLSQINVIAMSKGIKRNNGREFFHHNNQQSFQMTKNDKTLRFLQNIRDEAHRFAILSHRNLTKKSVTRSFLDLIKGIGQKRKKNLLSYFETINDIKSANEEDLIKVKNINKKLAKSILCNIREFKDQ